MEHRTHRVRYNSRRRTLEVQEKWHVTPKMLRMVLGGEDFEDFTTSSADDHIKLYVPSEAGDLAARDFTPRYFDTEAKKLTIDIALHSAGPAIRWAEQAQAGDVVEISGPRGSLMFRTISIGGFSSVTKPRCRPSAVGSKAWQRAFAPSHSWQSPVRPRNRCSIREQITK